MLNPDDVRSMLEGLGEPEVRRQIDAGGIRGDAAVYATRWLAARDSEAQAQRDRDFEEFRRTMRLMRTLVPIATGAAIVAAAMSFIVLNGRHW